MTCFHPLDAFQTEDGEIVFHERGKIRRELELPCGRCVGCRIARARAWAIRCVHEAQCHENSIFVTLTYDDDHYPGPSLGSVKDGGPARDLQLFIKRLRRRKGAVRFFACGEYGEEYLRPHFHVILFGVTFEDRKPYDATLFVSAELDKIWGFGSAKFGAVTMQSAGYTARYSIDKVNGDLAEDHYKRVNLSTGEIVDVTPEFGRMSLKPGIGFPWFARYWRDVYAARDGVVISGRVVPTPVYYDRYMAALCSVGFGATLFNDKEYDRYINSEVFASDCTPERLAVREEVVLAGLDFHTTRNLS
ncbi:MAG: replication initiator protein [Microvirus sp.]|nr:MAG: replication initiator protein [Microvirus sp.]